MWQTRPGQTDRLTDRVRHTGGRTPYRYIDPAAYYASSVNSRVDASPMWAKVSSARLSLQQQCHVESCSLIFMSLCARSLAGCKKMFNSVKIFTVRSRESLYSDLNFGLLVSEHGRLKLNSILALVEYDCHSTDHCAVI